MAQKLKCKFEGNLCYHALNNQPCFMNLEAFFKKSF